MSATGTATTSRADSARLVVQPLLIVVAAVVATVSLRSVGVDLPHSESTE